MEQTYAEWFQEEMEHCVSAQYYQQEQERQGFESPRAPSKSPITLQAVTPQASQIEQMERVSAQYHQQQQQREELELPRAPSYSPIMPQVQQASAQVSAASESEIFPADLPSPSVPIRLEPHSSILDHLTRQYNAVGPQPNIPHVNHAHKDQVDVSETLGQHFTDRMPFIRATSRRLQAVIGVRNDLQFDLLMGTGKNDADNLVLGPNRELVDLGRKVRGLGGSNVNANVNMDMKNINADTGESSDTTGHVRNIHAALNALPASSTASNASSQHQQSTTQPMVNNITQHSEAYKTPTITPAFPPSVNPITGQGLRDYLLTRALITGSKKRECRSISFHDFTPDVRTGEFRNELLEHFGVDGKNERVEIVELSLPDANGTLHPWLSILIQRPLVTLSTPSASPSTSTPPNFPHPTPTSWLCLAVPLANITTYPIQPDTSLPSSLLETILIKNKHGLPTKKIAKRQDYDFSFQGVPIFEFSTRSLFAATFLSSSLSTENGVANANANSDFNENVEPIADFLSVNNLPPYDPKDPYRQFPSQVTQNPELLHSIACKYAYESGLRGEKLATFGEIMVDDQGIDISEELSPNEGVWWSVFYRGMSADRIKWAKIRRSMGRGRCRVVVRWQDVPEEFRGMVGDSDAGLSRRTSEVEKIMEEMTKESLQWKKRRGRKGGMMSAGDRQNVGLGVMNANVGTHAYTTRPASGEALRNSLRAKAIGNRMSMSPGVSGGYGTQK
ncbi:hypothetical protein SBOR_1489 [Sclerotinia borealis F-4128]|uniref:Uncharacterized protein n=1 Tax=Sclerotinia borealis (strain F-4128) TaxID=1432307 RepID=W9CUB4_SCLBF|nr:hypothetical protein SBOR_1489 [Sclerotinia borealis F-4128]